MFPRPRRRRGRRTSHRHAPPPGNFTRTLCEELRRRFSSVGSSQSYPLKLRPEKNKHSLPNRSPTPAPDPREPACALRASGSLPPEGARVSPGSPAVDCLWVPPLLVARECHGPYMQGERDDRHSPMCSSKRRRPWPLCAARRDNVHVPFCRSGEMRSLGITPTALLTHSSPLPSVWQARVKAGVEERDLIRVVEMQEVA